jgi:hypothetical protein
MDLPCMARCAGACITTHHGASARAGRHATPHVMALLCLRFLCGHEWAAASKFDNLGIFVCVFGGKEEMKCGRMWFLVSTSR